MTTIPDNIIAYAKKGREQTSIPTSVILAQWIIETAGFTSDLYRRSYNLAGIKFHNAYSNTNGYSKYPDQETAANDWVRTINLSYYDKVRTAAKSNAPIDQIFRALGESPWASGHYDNGAGPGSSLLALWKSDNLGAFDNTVTVPPPVVVVPPPVVVVPPPVVVPVETPSAIEEKKGGKVALALAVYLLGMLDSFLTMIRVKFGYRCPERPLS